MSRAETGLPRGLRKKIRVFCAAVLTVVLAVGCLMCGTALRSMWRYQEATTQIREIQELRTQISRVSELLQSGLVGARRTCRSAGRRGGPCPTRSTG
ncbi:hypothetical protein [uncultured Oscillibacter sp.]|uniref:hypothetical protein n=1 Tax=uncultured Oscillibacter sp. TaxID=876091 RepID=UPI002635A176|nr:hypothetical protein [uncultured Oscillibacter sp.]